MGYELNTNERRALNGLVEARGVNRAAAALTVTPTTLLRIFSGQPARRGSILLVAANLQRLGLVSK